MLLWAKPNLDLKNIAYRFCITPAVVSASTAKKQASHARTTTPATQQTFGMLKAMLRATLALFFTPKLGPIRIKTMLKHFGNAENALAATTNELRELGLGSIEINKQENLDKADQELERAAKTNLSIIDYSHEHYPEALWALDDPPPVLWVRGNISALAELRGPTPRSIGIVGTRKCSNHARMLAARLARDLANAGITIVSGLARGIDTEAHRAAIDAGGKSIGVLGCGADRIYPTENKQLAEQLTVVSAYAIGTPPAAHNFPARNRIIAGLSSGSIVVEGDTDSGAMITASVAVDAGRTVFAMPGLAGTDLARGPHRLLREGAVLTESAEDVLQEMNWSSTPKPTPTLEGDEEKIFAAIGDAEILLDDIVSATNLEAGNVMATLMMLNLKGMVRELPGGKYARA